MRVPEGVHDRLLEVSRPLLRLGCRRRSVFLVALSWILATRPLVRTGHPVAQRHRGDARILVLPKVGGTEDMLAAIDSGGAAPGIALLEMPRDHVKHVFEALIGPEFPTLQDFHYRVGDPSVEAAKLRYRHFLGKVLRAYLRVTRVQAITSAVFNYRAERELAAACTDVGVPFLAIHKESIRTPLQRPWFTKVYRDEVGPFLGHAAAVYNADEKRSFTEAGVADVDRVRVIGCPRMDVLHAVRDRRPAKSTPDAPVVLFSIDIRAGAWTPYDESGDVRPPCWEQLARLTEEAFVESALRHPERPHLVKVKTGMESQQVSRLRTPLPGNLHVITGGVGTDLLRSAAAVVGFNSTALLEALAAGVPTIVPGFGEASHSGAEGWTFDLTDAADVAGSPEQLVDMVSQAILRPPSSVLSDGVLAALERHTGNADGRSGERLLGLLREATLPR